MSIQYPYQINGKPAFTSDRTPTQAQLLADAGFEPAEDFVLIQRTSHGSRVVSSDDVLELDSSPKEFFAFESGVCYELMVNGHSIWWGADKIEIQQIRTLGNVAEDDDLVWERLEAGNDVLALHGAFNLAGGGVEHLKTHKRVQLIYHYFVNGIEYTSDQEQLTGAQITSRIEGWDPANSLVLEGEGSEPDEVIHPTTTVVLKRNNPAHMVIVPPATFGLA